MEKLNETQIEKLSKHPAFTRWTKYGRDRLYIDIDALFNIKYNRSNSGWKNSITIDGEEISGSKYRKNYESLGNSYFDLITNTYSIRENDLSITQREIVTAIYDKIETIANEA